MKNFVVFTLLSLIYSTSAYSGNEATDSSFDYDQICVYFGQLKATTSKKNMSAKAREEYISKRVSENLAEQSDARALWHVIRYAVPKERYEIFRSTVEDLSGQNWECPAMQELISTTGE